MKRLFWVAVGAGIAVVVIRKATEVREYYSPPAVVDRAVKGAAEQATTFAGRLREAAGAFLDDLDEARTRREAELHGALAAEGRAPADRTDARGQASRLREQARTAARWGAEPVSAASSGRDFPGRTTRLDDDEDDLPYSF